MSSLTIGPIICGPMTFHAGWRSFWWLNVAILAFTLVTVALFFPETRWHRLYPDEHGRENSKPHPVARSTQPKDEPIKEEEALKSVESAPVRAEDRYLRRGSPSRAQFLFAITDSISWRIVLLDLWIIWKLFFFPIIDWSGLVVGFSCATFLVANLTQSAAFAAPPYNMNSQNIGKPGTRPFPYSPERCGC